MEFTGERFVPEVGGEIRQEHLHRYVFACALARGKRVLDAACGEGYGSALLARHAKSVIGVDIDAASVVHARSAYGSSRVRFEQADVTALPLPDQSVDLVVSFETLEHLAAQEAMVSEFRRVLRRSGQIMISTPNRKVYTEESGQINPHHVKELDEDEFLALLHRHFDRVQLFGQRFATASAIYPLATSPGVRTQVVNHSADRAIEPGLPPLQSPTYFLALAGDGVASELASSLMLSRVDDLYRQFLHVARWASGIDTELKTARAGWTAASAHLEEQVSRRQEQCDDLERQLAEERAARHDALRDGQLALEAATARELQLSARIVSLSDEADEARANQSASQAQAAAAAAESRVALDALQHKLEVAEAAGEAARLEALHAATQRDEWKARHDRAEAAAASLGDTLREQLAAAQAEAAASSQRLADAQAAVKRLRDALEREQAAAVDLRERLAQDQAAAEELREALAHAQAEATHLGRELADTRTTLQAREEESRRVVQLMREDALRAATAAETAARLAMEQRIAERTASNERIAELLEERRQSDLKQAACASALRARADAAEQQLARQIEAADSERAAQALSAAAERNHLVAVSQEAARAFAERESALRRQHEERVQEALDARQQAAAESAAALASAAAAAIDERRRHAQREQQLLQQLERMDEDKRGELALLQRHLDETTAALQQALAQVEGGRSQAQAAAASAASQERAWAQVREERLAQRAQLALDALRHDLQSRANEHAQERAAWARRLADWRLETQLREREWLGTLRQQRSIPPPAPPPGPPADLRPPAVPLRATGRRTDGPRSGSGTQPAAAAVPDKEARMLPSVQTPPVASLDELLSLDDASFVRSAYVALLGRPADEAGHAHYLRALTAGRPRVLVLADLRNSPEGRRRPVSLPGLERALRRSRLSRLPFIGKVFAAPPAPAAATLRRDVIRLADDLGRIDDTLQDRLAELQHALQVGIQGLAQHAVQTDARIDARLAQIEHALGDALQGELRMLSRQGVDSDERQHERLQEVVHVLDGRLQRAAQALDTRIQQLQGDLDTERQALLALVQSGQQAGQIAQGQALSSMSGVMTQSRQEAALQAQVGAITQALSQHTWPEETDLWREVSGWLLAPGIEFTQRLFKLMLHREARPHEVAHFTARLAQGASHWMLVDKMIQSPEFTHLHPRLRSIEPAPAPSTPDLEPTPTPPPLAAMPPAAAAAEPGPLPKLPCAEQPLVSVIIPIYGKLDYTLRCLRSIAAHPPVLAMEVIVVDDCSPDESAAVLGRVEGLRLLRNEGNQGFIRSCNRGAAAARGDYLCMLNNDTEVAPGWLDELHRTFDLFPGTGLAGSKLLYPDGRLQEAGGILWRDGSAWNFGHGQDPEQPQLNYTREVDYCSGASIMLPADLYRSMGGFDEHYLPAYCEDSDLAMKVRQAGLRVLYQPLSQVVHYEGVTSGTDTGSGVKAYQVVNSRKLYERWQPVLAKYQSNGVDVDVAKDRGMRGRVLVVDIVTPTPDQDAGSVTVVNLLTLLREMKLQVTFIPEDNYYRMPQYTAALQRIGVEALYAPYVTSVEQHVAACGDRYDAVLLWRPTVVAKHLATIRRHCARAKVLYHTIDLHYLRLEREADVRRDESSHEAARRMKAMELDAVRAVDCAIVHSTHELEVLRGEIPVDNVVVFPLIVDVPGSRVPFAAREGVVFVGGYQHVPNVDAAVYFVQEVMPLLRQRLPGVRFHMVGSNAPESVLSLAGPDVVFEGFVPQLAPLLDRMRLSVAPLRYGAGIKGKIGSSMAMGLPVVASPVAAEGMQLRHGEEVLIADGPEQTADAICRAYHDEALWSRLQAAGKARIEALSGPQTAYDILRDILRRLGLEVGIPAHALRLYRDRL